ncbi:synaptotagmin-15-like [Eriocheir sinensis]|uniref:synaptotagmin-15-like n=1 Tax=Eriocheir sinensis TaxID=95602 RepID=UPI0021C951D4|nr:synaptotagmin-15-like [Eriocheir sinensis]XP_050698161.1 synaptotagmin-15-like [Eriocheir sinensis]
MAPALGVNMALQDDLFPGVILPQPGSSLPPEAVSLTPHDLTPAPLHNAAVEMMGGVWVTSLVAAGAGVAAVLVVVAAVWAWRRRAANRKGDEERQQILLWPGAGNQPCSFQTREIRFTLPPSLAPLGSALDDSQADDDDYEDLSDLAPLATQSGSGHLQDSGSASSSSLTSLTSLDASEARRASLSDQRRRSLQGYSLGTLNPELYRIPDHLDDPATYPDGHLGRLFFTLQYVSDGEKLQVGILRVRNLPSRTLGSTNACDPYIRLSVLPDERRYLQTKQKKKTCNPVFDEHFGFHIPIRCVGERTLRLTVLDGGRPKRQGATVGHVYYPLGRVLAQPPAESAPVMTRDLVREDENESRSNLGELLVSLTYNDTLHRLSLTVFQGRGVKVGDGETVSWVKASLMAQRRTLKSKKSAVVAAVEEPHFNQPFHFRPPAALEGVHLNLTLSLAANAASKGRPLGRVVIGPFMFARGRGLTQWNQALAAPKEPIQFWHPLME